MVSHDKVNSKKEKQNVMVSKAETKGFHSSTTTGNGSYRISNKTWPLVPP